MALRLQEATEVVRRQQKVLADHIDAVQYVTKEAYTEVKRIRSLVRYKIQKMTSKLALKGWGKNLSKVADKLIFEIMQLSRRWQLKNLSSRATS